MKIKVIYGEYDLRVMVELIYDRMMEYSEELREEVYSRLIEKVKKSDRKQKTDGKNLEK